MSSSLASSVRAGLVGPLIVVFVLGGALGFVAGSNVYATDAPARVSVIATNEGPAPTTPAPLAEDEEGDEADAAGTGSGTQPRDRRCPSGCECSFPSGGIIIRCGGSTSVVGPGSVDGEVQTPQPRPAGPPPSMPDLPGMG